LFGPKIVDFDRFFKSADLRASPRNIGARRVQI